MASLLTFLLACGAPVPADPSPAVDTAPIELAVDFVTPAMALNLLDGLLDEVSSPDCEASLFEDGLYPEGAGSPEFWAGCPGFGDQGTVERYEDPVALGLMRDLKQLLDPLGVMNPGKVLRRR